MSHHSDTHQWVVQVLGILPSICSWIGDKGGYEYITAPDIINELVMSFLTGEQLPGYLFVPTAQELIGIASYFLGFVEQGNQATGCEY